MPANFNCDGSTTHSIDPQVRLLPITGGAHMHVCKVCYHHEMAYRQQRNKILPHDNQFQLPSWESLPIEYN